MIHQRGTKHAIMSAGGLANEGKSNQLSAIVRKLRHKRQGFIVRKLRHKRQGFLPVNPH